MRLFLLAVLSALSAPALAQETTAEKPVEKKICRRLPTTGSIMGKRECHTKAEWDAMSERSKNDRDKLDRDTSGRNGGLGISRD